MGCGPSLPVIDRPVSEPPATNRLETRILQDDVVDVFVDSPEPKESRPGQLPEGDFIDGKLGILEEDEAEALLGELEEGQLFEDPDFPADTTSLSYTNPDDEELESIVWLRPHELSEDPQMFVDGISRSDVKQGILGDCWFLSACASIATRPDLIEKVVRPGQVLSGDDYRGILYICFWRFGQWVTVHIDDRLPVKDGALLYGSCADPNEFWVAFVEKAYANDPRWELVDEETKEAMGVTDLADGEFWMEFTDFQRNFEEVTVATLGPDFDRDGVTDIPKQVKIEHGSWVEGENAGGCRNDLEKFARNPQYLLTLTERDDFDPESEEEPKCSILVGLMQEHRRSEKNKELRMLAISFFIYKTDTPNERLSAEYFLCVPEEGSSGVFTNSREVLGRFELEPGTYVIIPSTFYPDRSRNFMLRVFALKPFTLEKLPDLEILLHELDTDIVT
ncbi:calpain-A [Anabrus simplex]|uniref:calpain-A n=1 Tax=Anabrus simplex TaxID=316456 RepID=UPI0035A2BA02